MKKFKKVILSLFLIFISFSFVPAIVSEASAGMSLVTDNTESGDTGITERENFIKVAMGCNGGVVAPSIVGNYVDNYGYPHTITPEKWIMGGGSSAPSMFKFCTVDNSSQVIVARNAFNNPYFPNRFSQFNWTNYEGNLWYCQIVYDAETKQEAAAHPPADATNPSTGGCGPFPWSQLIVK